MPHPPTTLEHQETGRSYLMTKYRQHECVSVGLALILASAFGVHPVLAAEQPPAPGLEFVKAAPVPMVKLCWFVAGSDRDPLTGAQLVNPLTGSRLLEEGHFEAG